MSKGSNEIVNPPNTGKGLGLLVSYRFEETTQFSSNLI